MSPSTPYPADLPPPPRQDVKEDDMESPDVCMRDALALLRKTRGAALRNAKKTRMAIDVAEKASDSGQLKTKNFGKPGASGG